MGIEPEVVVLGLENGRHPRVDGRDDVIRVRREEGARLERLAVVPAVPDRREAEGFAGTEAEVERALRGFVGPFVEPVGGHEAATAAERTPKGGTRRDGLCSSIDVVE